MATLSRVEIEKILKSCSPAVRRQLEAALADMPKGSKLGNTVLNTPDGVFHSIGEYERWKTLQVRERAGEISDLFRQVEYELKINQVKVFSWFADFVYYTVPSSGNKQRYTEIVEDFKGFRTDVYRIKKKCIEAAYGIRILETSRTSTAGENGESRVCKKRRKSFSFSSQARRSRV